MKITKTAMESRAEDMGRYVLLNGSTVRSVASKFGVSKSTAHKDITERLKNINFKLYIGATNVLRKNKSERNIRGGAGTKAKYEKISGHKHE